MKENTAKAPSFKLHQPIQSQQNDRKVAIIFELQKMVADIAKTLMPGRCDT